MKSILNKRITQFIIISTALILGSAQSGAFAASKTITCYKGSATKSVTGTNPKCPTGYSLTKPAAAPTAKASTAATTTADRKSTRLNSSHSQQSRMPSSA